MGTTTITIVEHKMSHEFVGSKNQFTRFVAGDSVKIGGHTQLKMGGEVL